MKVFKFGGGSVKDAANVRQLENILSRYAEDRLIVVISAIGKTTNHLESLLNDHYGNKEKSDILWQELWDNHYHIANELTDTPEKIMDDLRPLFENLRNQLNFGLSDNYDFDYDQVVSFGELFSTTLISSYLRQRNIKNYLEDARTLIKTDDSFREGKVDWKITTPLIRNRIGELFSQGNGNIVITQGFIGGTLSNETTTLGREGSDYSAAIFAYSVNAEEIIIWKDVPGFFNADPKVFPGAVKLDRISYEEAIELAYYGANIIHPKTLKPLQNKQIPLYVKSFFNPDEAGTVISCTGPDAPVDSYIFKKNQILISIFPKDFSFIAVNNLSEIFSLLSIHKININLMQNSALSFSICVDDHSRKIQKVIEELKMNYIVKYNDKVELATIRHYSDESLNSILAGKTVLIEQKNRTTIQLVLKNKRKNKI